MGDSERCGGFAQSFLAEHCRRIMRIVSQLVLRYQPPFEFLLPLFMSKVDRDAPIQRPFDKSIRPASACAGQSNCYRCISVIRIPVDWCGANCSERAKHILKESQILCLRARGRHCFVFLTYLHLEAVLLSEWHGSTKFS